jgi:hypothetical protein
MLLQATLPLPNTMTGYMPLAPLSLAQQLRTNLEAEQRAHHSFLNNCFSKVGKLGLVALIQVPRTAISTFPVSHASRHDSVLCMQCSSVPLV